MFLGRERRGRLFDFFEGGTRGPRYRFAFADIPDDLTTDKLGGAVLDSPLLQVFKRRVHGDPAPPQGVATATIVPLTSHS